MKYFEVKLNGFVIASEESYQKALDVKNKYQGSTIVSVNNEYGEFEEIQH